MLPQNYRIMGIEISGYLVLFLCCKKEMLFDLAEKHFFFAVMILAEYIDEVSV